jgi:hypothetical protein
VCVRSESVYGVTYFFFVVAVYVFVGNHICFLVASMTGIAMRFINFLKFS